MRQPRYLSCNTLGVVDAEAALSGLTPPWREAFELAWASYQAGSPPVGAVVVGPDGAVIAKGRSRRGERSAPTGQLAGSRLAHAEINALAQLPVHAPPDVELFVTLEPCLVCWAAIGISHVPRVGFAGVDPVWRFLGDLSKAHPELEGRAYAVDGPLKGPMGAWATLLPIVERLWRNPSGVRIEQFRAAVPSLLELAQQLVTLGTATQFMSLTHQEALALVWKDLQRAVDKGQGHPL